MERKTAIFKNYQHSNTKTPDLILHDEKTRKPKICREKLHSTTEVDGSEFVSSGRKFQLEENKVPCAGMN